VSDFKTGFAAKRDPMIGDLYHQGALLLNYFNAWNVTSASHNRTGLHDLFPKHVVLFIPFLYT
jgi:hypothetical protein